jgi:hypothetical protein
MSKRTKTALSGEEMLELYKNNIIDENFDNPQSLRNLLEYQSELIAAGKSSDTEILTMCSERLFKSEKHKEPDPNRLFPKLRLLIIFLIGMTILTLATATVCEAFGFDFFENIFMRSGETTLIYANVDNPNQLGISDGVEYEIYGDSNEEEADTEETTVMTKEELIESFKPKWLPDGYELTDSYADETVGKSIYHFCYESNDAVINISVNSDDTNYAYQNNNDGDYYETYEYAGISHIISTNNDTIMVCWKMQNRIFDIMATNVDINTLKRIINSYYEEEK